MALSGSGAARACIRACLFGFCAFLATAAVAASPSRFASPGRGCVRAVSPRALGPLGSRDESRDGAIGGAVLGGLIAGPFGALWGASLGNALGAGRREEREREQQLEEMGLDRQTRQLAAQIAAELAEAEAALAYCTDAERSQLSFVERLCAGADEAYAAAEARLRAGDEAGARERLAERQDVRERLGEAELRLGEARERTQSMRRSLGVVAANAAGLEVSLKSAVADRAASASRSSASALGASLPPEDPILEKFRKLEGR